MLLDELCCFLGCQPVAARNWFKRYEVNFKKRRSVSVAEYEISKFIKQLVPEIEIINNSRNIISPKELDIYLPEYNLAIEYNGLFWHSHGIGEKSVENNPELESDKHLNKTKLCQEKDIDLIHIFEGEYELNKWACLELIAFKLNKVCLLYIPKKWLIHWGKPPKESKIISRENPQKYYFHPNYKLQPFKLMGPDMIPEELFKLGYRIFFDCGVLNLDVKQS